MRPAIKINAFAAASRIPAANTSYNTLMAIEPAHLIRMAVGVGFRRARLRYAYMLLRVKIWKPESFQQKFSRKIFEFSRMLWTRS